MSQPRVLIQRRVFCGTGQFLFSKTSPPSSRFSTFSVFLFSDVFSFFLRRGKLQRKNRSCSASFPFSVESFDSRLFCKTIEKTSGHFRNRINYSCVLDSFFQFTPGRGKVEPVDVLPLIARIRGISGTPEASRGAAVEALVAA